MTAEFDTKQPDSGLDLAALRRQAELSGSDWADTILALLDRIEELEREVAGLTTEEGQRQPPYKPMSPEVRAILDKYRV